MNKDELQNIISGKSEVKYGAIIQAQPVTLKEAKTQAQWLKTISSSKSKKQKS